MFFRRAKPHEFTFEERLENLKKLGFEIKMEAPGRALVTRGGCGAIVESASETPGDGGVKIGKAGVLMGGEIGLLVNHGYQMFLSTPSGRERPALASHLRTLHAFDEDLREGLGLTSLYNLSLGTTTDEHLYDRVEERDEGPHSHPWDKKAARAT
jgi:hypothetical protein